MAPDPIVVFVCEHGAAKSVIAAAYFNKLAGETGLRVRAIARGTNPDPQLSPITIAGLHADGPPTHSLRNCPLPTSNPPGTSSRFVNYTGNTNTMS